MPVAKSSQIAIEMITQDEVKSSLNEVGNHRFIYRMFFKLYDVHFYTDAVQADDIDKLLDGKNALLLEFDFYEKSKNR